MDKFLIQDVIDRLAPSHSKREAYERDLRLLNSMYDTDMREHNGIRIQSGCSTPQPIIQKTPSWLINT